MWLYNLGISLYAGGIRLAALWHGKARLWSEGRRNIFERMEAAVRPSDRIVWVHAASLGEFEQARPIIERLRAEHPEYKILLTFFSPSGYEVRKDYQGADIICYLPLDTIRNARRFLRTVRPMMAFFIKYEFWYNYLHILRHRGVPTYSVSSIFRPDQIFFRWYGRSYANVLKCFTRFFVQNEESRRLLANIGITDVEVVGDTRFDRVVEIKEAAKQLPIVESFVHGAPSLEWQKDGDEPKQLPMVFVAGSSWPPDEDIFIPYFNQHKDWKMIIAPHVIGEDHLKQIISKIEGKVVRYTEATPENVADANVLIIDCFGLLSSIYHYGSVAYVGGGFGVGIHNTLEAGVWGVPVIFGPNNKHFAEAQGLLQCGGGLEIHNDGDFNRIMQVFTEHPEDIDRAGNSSASYVNNLCGATDKILESVKKAH